MVTRGEQRGENVDIEGADILVAGGRGLGRAEGFELCEELAKALGPSSAVAATRAVVDAGWYPYAGQIGQTGKTVAPKLYFAAGISGAIQHKVGMASSENIVAVNKDANAPIFEFADLGIVGDLNRILPKLTAALERARRQVALTSSPADYPPPVDSRREFIRREIEGEDDRIEVGVAIIGGGTAGLACANRLLALLADDQATAERLGEVPVAVIEKAKACGGHSLSGAVMRPEPLLERCSPTSTREQWRREGFAFGEVTKEAVYMLPSRRTKLRIPTPPPFRNHGSGGRSRSPRSRASSSARAEEAGAYVLTETAATQLIVADGAVVGVRSGDKGRGKDGEPLSNFEPGSDIAAQATVLAEGSWGHLTGAAIREFDLAADREPQVWELGVKEVWRVPEPLDRVIHTIGPWPLKLARRYGQIGGTWIYPMRDERTRRGPRRDRLRDRPRLRRRDDLGARPAPAVQAAPARARHPRRRRARRLGREGAPRRRLVVDAASCRCPAR